MINGIVQRKESVNMSGSYGGKEKVLTMGGSYRGKERVRNIGESYRERRGCVTWQKL